MSMHQQNILFSQINQASAWIMPVGKLSNLFIIMDDVKDINYDDIKKFGSIKCKGKVLFTAKEYPEFDYVLPLSHYKGKQRVGSYMLEKNPFTQTFPFDHDFDYIKWLNTGKFLKGNHRKG